MKWAAFIYFLFSLLAANAQFGQNDSVMLLNGPCELQPYQNTLKTDFGLDARRTLFQKNWIAVGGLRLGVQYRRIHRIGFGFYFLNPRIFVTEFDFPITEDVVEYDFGYTSIYYERVLYFDRKWEFGAGLHLGNGRVNVFYNPERLNNRVLHDVIPFNMTELAMSGEYKILYWVSIGAGAGYRRVWGAPKSLRNSFSSPIFVVSLQLKFFKLARSFFDESVKTQF